MYINERILGMCESLCFVRLLVGGFGVIGEGLAGFYITNAIVAPEKWFINVHQYRLLITIRTLSYKLMNLMNFNELACYLRLFFAMYLKGCHGSGFRFQVSSSSMYIKNGGLA